LRRRDFVHLLVVPIADGTMIVMTPTGEAIEVEP
jgi:hypothetical protein